MSFEFQIPLELVLGCSAHGEHVRMVSAAGYVTRWAKIRSHSSHLTSHLSLFASHLLVPVLYASSAVSLLVRNPLVMCAVASRHLMDAKGTLPAHREGLDRLEAKIDEFTMEVSLGWSHVGGRRLIIDGSIY